MQQAIRSLFGLTMVSAMAAIACGCVVANPEISHAQMIRYHHVSKRTAIDPKTGETIITSTWQYDDGYTTTTTKRIPRGNEDRRGERAPRPTPRFRD